MHRLPLATPMKNQPTFETRYLCSRPLPADAQEQRWLRRTSRQEATAAAAPPVPSAPAPAVLDSTI